jgi:hypothetical protein
MSVYSLLILCTAEHGGMESCPMNEFGEPNMGILSVRFDEGRWKVGHWPFNPSSPAYSTTRRGIASPAISTGSAIHTKDSPGLRDNCTGVRGWLHNPFNLRGLYDAQGFFAGSIVVRFPRLSVPSEPSLAPQTARPLAPCYFKPAQDRPAAPTGASP